MAGKENLGLVKTLQRRMSRDASSLSEVEAQLEVLLQDVGREVLEQHLKECDLDHPEPTIRCSHCGAQAQFSTRKTSYVKTGLGTVRYRRAVYRCSACRAETSPLDERLDPEQSLARMRAQIRSERWLPVGKMAKSWGLGTLNGVRKDTRQGGE
jgi:DNA-directed RNA polymerase subunit RPC12/RpoP